MNNYFIIELDDNKVANKLGHQEIDFCIVRLDEIYKVKLEQMFRVTAASKVLSKGYGLHVSSVVFTNFDITLVSGDTLESEGYENLYWQILDRFDEAQKSDPWKNYIVLELDDSDVDALPNIWPDVSLLTVDSDGDSLEFYFIVNDIEIKAYVVDISNVFDTSVFKVANHV